MKETTRHIILVAKNRYEKQGGIKAVISKITGVEEKYLEKRAITYWYRDACNDMNIPKDKIIDSIIEKTQSLRKYEDSQDIIIEALRLQLTFLNVLDEDDNVVLDLGEPDIFNDEPIEIIGFPPNLTTQLINSDRESNKEFIVPVQFTDRKNGFIEENSYLPVLKVDFIADNTKINNLKMFIRETSGDYIDMSKILTHKDKLKALDFIKDNLQRVQKSFNHFTDKTLPITKDNIEWTIEELIGDNNDN